MDISRLLEGTELGTVLWEHADTFARITSVPVETVQSGSEPQLAMETKSRLFSIAHNALTNAFRHARAGRVEVRLDFGDDRILLSVSDDGIGLPDDFAERGRGVPGMTADAERLGGTLSVETGGPGMGTTVRCVMPNDRRKETS